ncbi:hypothetical protein NP233_g6803 [Leucocoprinus birnbaumii]|uniref:Integrase zinc-binding domain-containing protein n=1 Tax=Leucocoprinus birnbaumii TaxID=56174 RepID=A0AAD5YQL5_9AGAR|nr:hypothetical protein NP233_g6803 [Leucocoprinus birnbaumii]
MYIAQRSGSQSAFSNLPVSIDLRNCPFQYPCFYMSPERPTNVRGSSTSKPYTRTSSSPSPSEDKNTTSQLDYPHTPEIDDDGQPGFPTRAQYQMIERGYIESLTPRRQGKALISQALFDRIWDVLHNADTVKENAQFRFWARKMFTLSKSHTVTLGTNGPRRMEQEVLLHDGLLVAVREQIYDLLCFCHGSTNHGGRDKTCALIRKHYTWVPKDLVAQFIKACPTCILKKCGHPEPDLISPRLGTSAGSPSIPAAHVSSSAVAVDEPVTKQEPIQSPLPSFRDYFNEVGEVDKNGPLQDLFPNSLPGTPLPGLHSQFLFTSEQVESSTPIDQLKQYNQLSSTSLSLPGFPMMREVSLYKGLPDGWQYQNIDYRTAHDDCIDFQRIAPILPYDPSLGRTRPRVPDIAPLFRADFEDYINYRPDEMDEGSFNLTSAMTGMSPQAEDYHAQPISPVMRDDNGELRIDPLLLALSASMRSQSVVEYPSPDAEELPLSDILRSEGEVDMNSPSPALLPGASSDIIVGGGNEIMSLPAFNLESLDSVKTFREFLSIRESLSNSFDTDIVKDGGNGLWRESNDGNESGESSPANSIRSNVSGLSLLAGGAGTASPASTTSTPITTAPVTPVDEVSNEKGGLVGGPAGRKIDEKGKGRDHVYDEDAEGVPDLNAVIQAVSICDVEY